MMARRRGGKRLTRVVGTRPERRTVLVFCEGEGSEPDYIQALRRLPRVAENTSLSIRLSPRHGVPLSLVNVAIDDLDAPEIDECWCVFDVEWPEHHPHLDEAIQLAEQYGVKLAISNPCFELWLILHYDNQTSFLSTADAVKKSQQLSGMKGKHLNGEAYMPHLSHAVERAENLEKRHRENKTKFPQDNPSSGMYRFVQTIGADSP